MSALVDLRPRGEDVIRAASEALEAVPTVLVAPWNVHPRDVVRGPAGADTRVRAFLDVIGLTYYRGEHGRRIYVVQALNVATGDPVELECDTTVRLDVLVTGYFPVLSDAGEGLGVVVERAAHHVHRFAAYAIADDLHERPQRARYRSEHRVQPAYLEDDASEAARWIVRRTAALTS